MGVSYDVDGRIAIITLDRADRRNAVDQATARALYDAARQFDIDNSVDVAVLTGAGGNFCAGADLKAMTDGTGGNRVAPAGDFGPMGPTRLQLRKPLIAAVEGYAVAGGLELALWADLRVAAEGAVFGVYSRRFGVPLIDLGTIRLPRLIGQSRAMDMILTGRGVEAREAFDIGLANRLVAKGQALSAAIQLARSIAVHPQTCLRNDRRSALEQWSLPWKAATEYEVRLGLETLASGETARGASRFSEGFGRGGTFAEPD